MSDPHYGRQYARALGPVRYAAGGHAAFVNRIVERLTDPTPSLVYADYLEEQGDHGAAELVRAAGPSANSEASGRYHGRFPHGVPHVDLYPTMYYPGNRRWRPDEEDQPHRLRLLHRVEGGHYCLGYSLTLDPEEAHRLVSGMPNIANADDARRELEERYPRLRRGG